MESGAGRKPPHLFHVGRVLLFRPGIEAGPRLRTPPYGVRLLQRNSAADDSRSSERMRLSIVRAEVFHERGSSSRGRVRMPAARHRDASSLAGNGPAQVRPSTVETDSPV